MVTVSRKALSLLVPATMLLGMVLLAKSNWFYNNPEALSMGIIFDLTLTVPLVCFLVIRKTDIPKITIIPVFVLGVVIASIVIPTQHQFYLSQVKNWVVPVVELTALTVIFLKVRKITLEFRKAKNTAFDFYSAIKQAVDGVIPKAANIFFATEIATFYYGFFAWKKRKLNSNEYSYHKDNSAVAILWVVLLLVLVETSVLHLLLMQWNVIAAWILSGVSIYTGFQVLGMLRSLSKRPALFAEETLELRFGIMAESSICYENIAHVMLSSSDIEESDSIRKLSPLGDLSPHNVIIHLKENVTLKSLYGFKKQCQAIALHIDEADKFKTFLDAKISSGLE